ncbi:hypothetical protein BSL82_01575 [Tardibacter chloracetimidivorans]|uniref:phosphoglycolate phosphatase n=1 Tax=Tardibacter chloracetimidivorans TaxID=1921510 RepID=A0A1L3ZR98_9SPHN|nr:HAD family hydrolase [Tardibacter chloracetimidivorans]API58149.1 hypothetical protein BSL82_01575 [Tardibacter chloracetimidivorans]
MLEVDWSSVRLVVFDVDGTLYRQRPVRLRMAAALVADGLRRRSLSTIRALGAYRRLREELADNGITAFETELVRAVAAVTGLSESGVSALVEEWMNRRPLPLLMKARYPGVERLFDAIRVSGRSIGVLSDYPAIAKLEALGLAADFIVAAADEGVGVMKPSPAGLIHLMERAGAWPRSTILIGDRPERDGQAGRRAGVRTYIRSSRPIAGHSCFASFAEFPLPDGEPRP